MKTVKVEKLWQGKYVDIRSYDAIDAMQHKSGILVEHKGQYMQIPYSEIETSRKKVSKYFQSKTGGKPYQLWSYEWKPGQLRMGW